jgi:hypothetical protein
LSTFGSSNQHFLYLSKKIPILSVLPPTLALAKPQKEQGYLSGLSPWGEATWLADRRQFTIRRKESRDSKVSSILPIQVLNICAP